MKIAFFLVQTLLRAKLRFFLCAAFVWLFLCDVAPLQADLYYEQIKSVGFPDLATSLPRCSLIESSDGVLYGTTFGGGVGAAGAVFKINKDGTVLRVLHSFNRSGNEGINPAAGVIETTDHKLYGTLSAGGASNAGAIFRLEKDGSDFRVIYHFRMSPTDGKTPYSALLEGSDGALYGTTIAGGSNQVGTVFRLATNGLYSVLHHFETNNLDARIPYASLIEASDGFLYGTAQKGGATTGPGSGYGAIFRVNKDGTSYARIHDFYVTNSDGALPVSPLLESGDGTLYGTAESGGAGYGCIFALKKDGSNYRVLTNFSGFGGVGPRSGLIETAEGALYGTTTSGGTSNYGTVFKLQKDGGGYTVFHHFGTLQNDGIIPTRALLEASDGSLYGTTESGGGYYGGGGTIFRLSKDGSAYDLISRCRPTGGDGKFAIGGVIEGTDGMLYGTTAYGGDFDQGTVYRMNRDGSAYTNVYHFPTNATISSRLLQGTNGLLYGTTGLGGSENAGTLFSVATNGAAFAVLRNFSYYSGREPEAPVIEGSDGRLYGTTDYGGPPDSNNGVVYAVNHDGSNYTVLQAFSSTGTNGYRANALTEGNDGFLYGTTHSGGIGGSGTAFKLNKDGTGFTKLRDFYAFIPQLYYPSALIEGSDGALYGVTEQGGVGHGGTAFRLTKDNSSFGILHNFGTFSGDGNSPRHALVKGNDGALYGVARGGANPNGVVFVVNNDGSGYFILHQFATNNNDGVEPSGPLLQGSDGAFYGTTSEGGQMQLGSVFRLSLRLSLQRTGNTALLTMYAIPGRSYDIQRAPALVGPWATLATRTAPTNTAFLYSDTSPPPSTAFYRFRRSQM